MTTSNEQTADDVNRLIDAPPRLFLRLAGLPETEGASDWRVSSGYYGTGDSAASIVHGKILQRADASADWLVLVCVQADEAADWTIRHYKRTSNPIHARAPSDMEEVDLPEFEVLASAADHDGLDDGGEP